MVDQAEMEFDRFGFAILSSSTNSSLKESDDERSHNYQSLPEMNSRSLLSWKRILNKWDHYRVDIRQEKVRKLIFKGIDQSIRSDFWRKALNLSELKKSSSFDYETHVHHLRQEMVTLGLTEYNIERTEYYLSNLSPQKEVSLFMNITAIRQILLDVGRSFPTHVNFMPNTASGVEGQAALFRVLAIYSIYNPKINYCQGMSYLGGMLLMQLEEWEAFWALVALLERRKYLSGYYNSKMERIQEIGKIFTKALERNIPDLSIHLLKLGIDPLLYLPKWILTVFTNLPCWDSVLLIWDLMLLDGSIVIFQTSLAILNLSASKLLQLDDINRVILFLQRIPHQIVNRLCLGVAIEEVRFENWEEICIRTLVHEETNCCTTCGCKSSACHCKRKPMPVNSSNTGVFRKMLRTLAWGRNNRVAPPAIRVVSDSDSSFEVVHSKTSPASQFAHTPKLCKGRGPKRLVGSSASLQMTFRQFQMPNPRRTSNIHKASASKDESFILSPLELETVNPNVTVRNKARTPKRRHHVLINKSPPSPVELVHLDRAGEGIRLTSTPNKDPGRRERIRFESVRFSKNESLREDNCSRGRTKSKSHLLAVPSPGWNNFGVENTFRKQNQRKTSSPLRSRKPLQNLNVTA